MEEQACFSYGKARLEFIEYILPLDDGQRFPKESLHEMETPSCKNKGPTLMHA